MNLIDLYKTFSPNVAECTFLSSTHGRFSRIDHVSENTSLGRNKILRNIST